MNANTTGYKVRLCLGLEKSTPCTTVNKVCASGMKAIMLNAILPVKDRRKKS